MYTRCKDLLCSTNRDGSNFEINYWKCVTLVEDVHKTARIYLRELILLKANESGLKECIANKCKIHCNDFQDLWTRTSEEYLFTIHFCLDGRNTAVDILGYADVKNSSDRYDSQLSSIRESIEDSSEENESNEENDEYSDNINAFLDNIIAGRHCWDDFQ